MASTPHNENTIVKYASFDPGEQDKGIGYALFDQHGVCVVFGQVMSFMSLENVLERTQIAGHAPVETAEKFIIEDYKIFGSKANAHIGSRVPTIQCIGVIKLIAQKHKIEVVMQPSSILPIAEKWTQIKMPSNHAISHQFSALLHGRYWLIDNGIAETQLEIEERARRNLHSGNQNTTSDKP